MVKLYPLRVAEIKNETSDTVSVVFDIPSDLAPKYKFTQGQYLTLEAVINGEKVRRAYSICSSANGDELRVAIKRIPNGKFSTYATEVLKVGDIVDVMPPTGFFYSEISANQSKNYLAVAAGSGITPILSILKTSLETEKESTFNLFYINKDSQSIIFKEELEQLKNIYMDRLSIYHLLTREKPDFDHFYGRINEEKMKLYFEKLIDPKTINECFLCGPEEMVMEMRNVFMDHGIPKKQVHYELFTAPKKKGETTKVVQEEVIQSVNGHDLTIIMDGDEYHFNMKDNKDYIVDAACAADIEVPYSCQAGVCSTCKAKVISGEVEMSDEHTLDEDEVAEGFVLTCICKPKSEKVTLDYDVL